MGELSAAETSRLDVWASSPTAAWAINARGGKNPHPTALRRCWCGFRFSLSRFTFAIIFSFSGVIYIRFEFQFSPLLISFTLGLGDYLGHPRLYRANSTRWPDLFLLRGRPLLNRALLALLRTNAKCGYGEKGFFQNLGIRFLNPQFRDIPIKPFRTIEHLESWKFQCSNPDRIIFGKYTN